MREKQQIRLARGLLASNTGQMPQKSAAPECPAIGRHAGTPTALAKPHSAGRAPRDLGQRQLAR